VRASDAEHSSHEIAPQGVSVLRRVAEYTRQAVAPGSRLRWSGVAGPDDVVLALPSTFADATAVRSTVLRASLENVREARLYAAYAKAMPPPMLEQLEQSIVGTWLPMPVATAHYAACDTLNVSPERAAAFGRSTVEKIGPTLMGTGLKMLKRGGATPWTVCAQFQRFWSRGYLGSSVGVYRAGPKDCRIVVAGISLSASPFFRAAVRGLVTSILEVFCTKAYGRDVAGSAMQFEMRFQWA